MPDPQAPELVVGVSDCIALINQTLEFAYPFIAVEGEVSGFKVNHNKYVFFDLKDDDGSLGCFMSVYQLRMPLEDGMRVRVVARPKVTPWGKFSLTVREVVPVGEGSLKRAYELLREKLRLEGLFDGGRKRMLPQYVEHIGLISSKQAAGFADFIKIMGARWPLAKVEVRHCRVQGSGAADDVIAAIRALNELAEPPEVIAIVRGGGSADDLACFNDETLVRAIAGSRVPVIAGVGHETDETLSSLAADVSASTPSNAAELLAPDGEEVGRYLHGWQGRIAGQLDAMVESQLQAVVYSRKTLRAAITHVLRRTESYVQASRALAAQLDPRAVLRRGYSLVRLQGRIVRDGRELAAGSILTVETAHAAIESEVRSVREK